MIASGLAILFAMLVMAPRRTGINPDSVLADKPFAPDMPRVFKPTHADVIASQALGATQPSQLAHATFFAAIEGETDSDRRSEALERAVESVSESDLPDILDSLMLDNAPWAAEMSLLLVRSWAESGLRSNPLPCPRRAQKQKSAPKAAILTRFSR